MAIVCDCTWINGVGTGIHIGDDGEKPIWEANFGAGGRHKNGNAVLVFMVRGLTGENGAQVFVNNEPAGRIEPYPGADPRHWFLQTINVTGGAIRDGNNEFQVNAAPATNPGDGNSYDDFQIKNIFCIFQQSA
jgi:hypothetical protein